METIGKYKILKELGAGGFGAVYLAADPHLGDKVAIKVFQIKDPALAREVTSATGDAGEILKQRFLDEAKILRKLSASPHVVSVHEFETLPDGCPYYVMPYLPNSLVDLIGRDAFTQGKLEEIDPKDHPRSLPITQVLDILKQTLEGLKMVHEAGLVHRDIKPANLLIETKGKLHNVVLCDFGIAKMPEGEHSKTGVGMGSPNYVSPEQRESAKHVDARSDVFSVGVLAYRMLTGSVPMVTGQQPIKQFMPAINDELNDLVMNAIDFDTAKRPANAGDFLKQLKQAESAFTGNLDKIEESGTWVNNGESGLKDELKPLRDEILKLLIEHGELPQDEITKLSISAQMVDLDDTGLEKLIEETYQQNEAKIKPKRKLISLVRNKLESAQELSRIEREALAAQCQKVGWDENKLDELIIQFCKTPNEAELNQTRPNQRKQKAKSKKHTNQANSTSQTKQNGTENNKTSIGIIIGFLFVLALGGGSYFYLEKQSQEDTRQAVLVKQQLEEQARLALLSAKEAKSEQIKQAQSKLLKLGYQLPQTGTLDSRTRKSIEAFEKVQGLIVTGKVDEIVLSALTKAVQAEKNRLAKKNAVEEVRIAKVKADTEAKRNAEETRMAKVKAAAEVKRRSKEVAETKRKVEKAHKQQELARIKLIQETKIELYRLGYEVGSLEDKLENNIQQAIKHYQKGHKLKQTGKVSENLLVHLGQATKIPGQVVGETFQDCSNCPKMVMIPAGSFRMGSIDFGLLNGNEELPLHRVTIAEPFAMGQFEVTWNNYQPCIDAGMCSSYGDQGWGKGNRPVIKVTWRNALSYANWLSKRTGKHYRLPTEAEWEYAARAGSTTRYSWGNNIFCQKARYGHHNGNCGNERKTVKVGSYKPNKFGLYDMHGNVSEWIQDCWNDTYRGASSTSKIWADGDCAKRVFRGGSWFNNLLDLRSANRFRDIASGYNDDLGFRLVQGR